MNYVKAISIGDAAVGSSVADALKQMRLIAEKVQPGTSPLAWDEDARDIADPYFVLFLRCPAKLSDVAKARWPKLQRTRFGGAAGVRVTDSGDNFPRMW